MTNERPLKLTPITSRSILTPASGFIGDFDYTLSPYSGFLFGCSYCYVPTLFYHRKLAAGWGRSLAAKVNAAELLRREGKAGKIAGKRIYLSPNTDPYTPGERRTRLTRSLLEVFRDYPPGLLVIQTRSPMVLDDIDLIEHLGENVVVAMSITTDDDHVRKLFEPRCASIQRRVAALATLKKHGIRTQASLSPLLPCDPRALASLVDAHCDWVAAQAFHNLGPGARTWSPALDIVASHGWESWLEGGEDARRALAELADFFGARFHEGRTGFGLRWLEEDRTKPAAAVSVVSPPASVDASSIGSTSTEARAGRANTARNRVTCLGPGAGACHWILEPEKCIARGICSICGRLRVHGPARLSPGARDLGRVTNREQINRLVANPALLASFRKRR